MCGCWCLAAAAVWLLSGHFLPFFIAILYLLLCATCLEFNFFWTRDFKRSSHRYLLLAALSSRGFLAGTSFRTPPPWHKLGNSVNIETAPLAIRGQRCCNSRCTHPIENPSVGHIPLDSYDRPLWAVLKSPSHLSIVHSPHRRRFMIASSFWNLFAQPNQSKHGAHARSILVAAIFARSVLQAQSQLLPN